MRKSYLFLFALMLTMLGFSDAVAQKIYKAELDASMFKSWDSPLPGASEVESDYIDEYGLPFGCENNLTYYMESGGVVYGNHNVYYLWYADLTGTQTMIFKGTPGVELRVLMNRPEPEEGGDPHGGQTVERNVTINDDGVATLDVSDLKYVHLNCIKMGWNSPEGAINTVLLNSNVKPAYNLLSVINNGDIEDDDLSSFPVSWDGPNNGNTAPDYPTIVEGEGIGGSRCITVTTYPEPTETWHTEFYVKANEVMPQGSKYRLTMSIRADRDIEIYGTAQGEPRVWKGGFADNFYVTTEWKEYTWTGEIGVDGFQSVAFALTCGEDGPGNGGATFYFDNIEFGYVLSEEEPITEEFALESANPEDGSFNLSGNLKEFVLTFNQKVDVSSVIASLGNENLTVTSNGNSIILTRLVNTSLNGIQTLVVSNVMNENGEELDPIVLKYSFGATSGDAQMELIYASNFSQEGEGALGAGWRVNADSEGLQDANSSSGCRLQHNRSGFAADVLYLASRSSYNGGVALYGIVGNYPLYLEAKTYHLQLDVAQWDAYENSRALKVQVLPLWAVDIESGSIWDDSAILAEDIKEIVPEFNNSKDATHFDVTFTAPEAGEYVIRMVPGKLDGTFNGYSDGCAIGNVKVQFIPDVLGIIESQQLADALQAAKDNRDAIVAANAENEIDNERYNGEDLTALNDLIAEVEANMGGYTAPSVYVAKSEELAAAAKAANDHKDACDTYDKAITETTELVAKFKDTKFAPTSYYQNLVKIARKYHATSEVTIITNPETGEDEFVIVATFDVLKDNEALAVASDEVVSVNLLAAKWLTEGKSEKGWNYITTGYAALHERIRRGVELLKSLGIADNDPLIVAAEAEFGDNDEIAEAIAFRAKSLILDDLAKGEESTFFEDEEASYDLSVFFKNPNVYANAYSTEVPGWTSVQGNGFAWSNWDSSQNHSVGTPYPEDCEIHAGWHPYPYAMVEQTVYNLPAGVYVVNIKCSDNGSSWDEGTCAFVRTSESPFIEAGQYIDRDIDFTTYLTGSGETEEITVTDGQLTIGFYYGSQSQAFFDDIELKMIAPAEGYDYGASQGQEHNTIYIADGQRFSTTKTNMLPISLKNEDEIVGFQFDVVLPEGMTLAKNARGKNLVTINGDRTDSHTLTASMVDDFTVRIVGTSMENEVLSGVDGMLLEMGIDVASWVPNGVYPIQLKDVKLTNSDRKTVSCSDKVFYVTVGGKLGDVNQDDAIDVTDAVLIIDHILMKNPSNFEASLADVNGDNEIDVTDVVMVIDAILGKIELSRGSEMIDRSAYTAFQMDLTIPAGYVLESVSLTDIAKDSHTLAYNMLADGRCRVIVCSMNNEALPGAWDEVISLNLRGKGDAQVNIDRAVFVTIDGQRHELMMNPTSIAQLSTLNSQLSTRYDLQGRKVEKTSKGILIENGKKIFK